MDRNSIKDECEECGEFPTSWNASLLRGGLIRLFEWANLSMTNAPVGRDSSCEFLTYETLLPEDFNHLYRLCPLNRFLMLHCRRTVAMLKFLSCCLCFVGKEKSVLNLFSQITQRSVIWQFKSFLSWWTPCLSVSAVILLCWPNSPVLSQACCTSLFL